jgi:hypothetical protein
MRFLPILLALSRGDALASALAAVAQSVGEGAALPVIGEVVRRSGSRRAIQVQKVGVAA